MTEIACGTAAVAIDFEGGHIASFCVGGREILSKNTLLPLFTLCLRDRDGESDIISAFDARECVVTGSGGDGYTASCGGFGKADISVEATVSPCEAPYLLKWRLSVANRTDAAIECVDYPQMAFTHKTTSDENVQIVWPYNEGVLVDDIYLREKTWFAYMEPDYPGNAFFAIYPGMVGSQFIAYMGDVGGQQLLDQATEQWKTLGLIN